MADDMRRRSDVRLEMPTSNRFPSRRKAANEENNQDQSNQEQDAPCIFAQQIPPSDKNHVTTDEMGLECHLSVRETASEADDQDQGSKQQKQPKQQTAPQKLKAIIHDMIRKDETRPETPLLLLASVEKDRRGGQSKKKAKFDSKTNERSACSNRANQQKTTQPKPPQATIRVSRTQATKPASNTPETINLDMTKKHDAKR
jgi:hypothetical protein